VRREFSSKRLFRCKACGWRGWAVETEEPHSAVRPVPRAAGGPQPNFKAIDKALEEVPAAEMAEK